MGSKYISFTVSPTKIIALSDSTTQTVNITSSTADSYAVSGPSWIRVGEKTDTYFTLIIAANSKKLKRLGTVTVTASAAGKDNVEVSISVEQMGTGIEVEPIEPKPL